MNAPKQLFCPGLIVQEEFIDYDVMCESAKNWSYTLTFRLGTGPFYGFHDGIQLYNLQHEGLEVQVTLPRTN